MGRQVTFDGFPQGEGEEAAVFFGESFNCLLQGKAGTWHLLVETVIKSHLAGGHSLTICSWGVLLFGWFMETGSPSPALEDSLVIFSHTPPHTWKCRETKCCI